MGKSRNLLEIFGVIWVERRKPPGTCLSLRCNICGTTFSRDQAVRELNSEVCWVSRYFKRHLEHLHSKLAHLRDIENVDLDLVYLIAGVTSLVRDVGYSKSYATQLAERLWGTVHNGIYIDFNVISSIVDEVYSFPGKAYKISARKQNIKEGISFILRKYGKPSSVIRATVLGILNSI